MTNELLLIDDDKFFIMMAKKMVAKCALHPSPLTFENGRLALDHLKEVYNTENVFILLLDINMPIMDGWGLLEGLKAFASPENTFVVMVTSSTDEADIKKAHQSPFVVDYLTKPLMSHTLNRLRDIPALHPFFLPKN
ncbi:response regulator [Runella slithyformis]|uniref:Response regulator receiver n=1 Tax=Runella slithyformis (strain ATCC 29530 / DSM 19594 / LMG 11500 / NCIMB 11436 / LSU 4) TaxID=761193 RepID=A0A7U3ZHP4_RUNSL|nr:response regulator [Runella slithyformis]AEI47417.1 response regulator receiver [Runella slithyformis DSM 19594]